MKDLEPYQGGKWQFRYGATHGALFKTGRCSFHPPPAPPTCTLQILYMTCCQRTRTDPQRAHKHLPRSAALFNATDVTQMLGCHPRLLRGGRGGVNKTSGEWRGFFKCSVCQNSNKSRVIQRTISGLSYFSEPTGFHSFLTF